ncbi:MAG: site-specific integrase [Vicinamibacterales bacterium]
MAERLNDRRIAALPVPTLEQRQRDYWDETLRGFGVRVSYGGKKAFVVRYRVNRRLRRLTLGPKAYLEVAEKRHRSWKEEKRIIDKDLLPEFGPRLLVDVRRRDVRELVEAIARKRNAPVMANRTLGVLSRMFNFALDCEWPEPGEERSRDRVLSDDELRELWVSLESLAKQVEPADEEEDVQEDGEKKPRITPATAQAFQVQLLTAQRPGEVRSMKWADVDLEAGWWSIPSAVAKNGQAHRVPLTRTVVDILKPRLKAAGESAIFVFENRRGAGSVAHRGKKAALALCMSLTFEFRAHDLRRTAATRMAEAGVPRDHIAKVLNHVEGGPAATRVYDRYDYDTEKRDALERWARRLAAIVEGKTKKVVAIRG